MPGPCSAPNGEYSLTTMTRSAGMVVRSGKTALKRGQIRRQKVIDDERRSRNEDIGIHGKRVGKR